MRATLRCGGSGGAARHRRAGPPGARLPVRPAGGLLRPARRPDPAGAAGGDRRRRPPGAARLRGERLAGGADPQARRAAAGADRGAAGRARAAGTSSTPPTSPATARSRPRSSPARARWRASTSSSPTTSSWRRSPRPRGRTTGSSELVDFTAELRDRGRGAAGDRRLHQRPRAAPARRLAGRPRRDPRPRPRLPGADDAGDDRPRPRRAPPRTSTSREFVLHHVEHGGVSPLPPLAARRGRSGAGRGGRSRA